MFHFSLWILDIWISKYTYWLHLQRNYHKWDKGDNSQIHTANVQVLQPRIRLLIQDTRGSINDGAATLRHEWRSLLEEGPPHVTINLLSIQIDKYETTWMFLLVYNNITKTVQKPDFLKCLKHRLKLSVIRMVFVNCTFYKMDMFLPFEYRPNGHSLFKAG